jgi:uncharacterized membrane protein YedE/YeeE
MEVAEMDWQAMFNIAMGLLIFVSGAVSTIVWGTLTALRTDMKALADTVHTHQKDSTNTYVRRDDFAAALIDLKGLMNRGFDQLAAQISGKEDKHS